MTAENVELMERLIAMWNAGDWEGVFAYYDDDIVLEDGLLPDGDTYRGIEAVRRRYDELQVIGGLWKAETESLLDAGSDVVWINRASGRGSEKAPPFEVVAGAVFSFEGGRVVRQRWFATPEAALEAAGLGA